MAQRLYICPICHEPYPGAGWACASCHEDWLANRNRHIHGDSAMYNRPRTPAGRGRGIFLIYDTVAVPGPLSPTPSAREQRAWSGAWDNAVRIIERRGDAG